MITGYFGAPGCGKTTILSKIAQKELRKIKRGKSKYDRVLTNFYCKGCERIDLLDLEKYKVDHCLLLFDELTIYADSRSYKSFPKGVTEFIVLHRHEFCDMFYFVQDYSRVDKTIRELTSDLWYVRRPVVPFFNQFSVANRVFRHVAINEHTSDLVLGYRFSKFLERIFAKCFSITFRPPWYKYFDSFDEGVLANRPVFCYIPWEEPDITVSDNISSSSGLGERSVV